MIRLFCRAASPLWATIGIIPSRCKYSESNAQISSCSSTMRILLPATVTAVGLRPSGPGEPGEARECPGRARAPRNEASRERAARFRRMQRLADSTSHELVAALQQGMLQIVGPGRLPRRPARHLSRKNLLDQLILFQEKFGGLGAHECCALLL